MPNSPRATALALAAVLALGACGGGDGPTKVRGDGTCKDEVPIRATFLPAGFEEELVRGPGGNKPEVEDAIAYHWAGPATDRYIDVFRGPARNKLKGSKVRMLRKTGRIGKISGGGFGAKVKLGRGTCTRYQFEAFGVSEADFTKFVGGLQRTPGATSNGE